MANARSSGILRQVNTLFILGSVAGMSDGHLLERFVARTTRDGKGALDSEAAFEALVARHGPMVLGVCRRSLRDPGDVEDAFQATFFVLVRRASSVHAGDSLGRWLYGVARRVAAKARARSERARERTSQLAFEPAAPGQGGNMAGLLSALDEELGRLPSKYRDPIVLCHFEGLTHAQAAASLRWPVGTVSGRLSRAHEMLKGRLVRRGLAPATLSIGTVLVGENSRAAVSVHLAVATSRGAARLMVNGISRAAVASSATSLMNEVLRSALMFKVKFTAVILLSVAFSGGVAATAGAGEKQKIRGSRHAELGVPTVRTRTASDRPAHRPADEIVAEIESLLKDARPVLSTEEWNRIHSGIASTVGELRTYYPEDVRGARLMPERWLALLQVRKRAEVDRELAETLETSSDAQLLRDAQFYRTLLRLKDPIGGRSAASLAEEFARISPGDKRAGELLYNASSKLDRDWYAIAGLSLCFASAGLLLASTAATKRLVSHLVRPCKYLLLLTGGILCAFGILANDRLISSIGLLIDRMNDEELKARMLYRGSFLLGEIYQQMRTVILTPRAGLSLTASAVVGFTIVELRRRAVGPPIPRSNSLRWGLVGFLGALAAICSLDAIIVDHLSGSLRDRLATTYPDSFRGRMAVGQRRKAERVGEPFRMEFADAISGRSVSMKAMRGKVVVVNFWATWCGPCLGEIPELTRIYRQYHDKGVEFVGVSLDLPEEDGGLESLRACVAEHQVPWPQYYEGHDLKRLMKGEPTGDFAESWGIEGIPQVFLVDAEGKLYSTDARGKLETLIPRLIADAKP
jgi:RNA polymerase sigma factor (sigma-70 family)